MAGLKVGDKVLKVNGFSVVEADHYSAVEVLKACGAVLVLNIQREVTRLVGHPVFGEDGVVQQIAVSTRQQSPAVVNVPIEQTERVVSATAKAIPSPIQIHSESAPQQQHLLNAPHSNGVIENGRVSSAAA